MPRTRNPYPSELREQIVALAHTGRSVEDLAKEFEPCAATIHGWIKQADRDHRDVVTLTGASHSLANSEPRSGRHAHTLPNLERCGSKLFVHRPFEEMALVVEGVVSRGVDVEEALR